MTTTSQPSIASSLREAIALAWHLGYIIAIPVVLFGFAGAKLDKAMGTSPIFIISGFLLAAILSSIGVARKIRRIIPRI